MAIVNKFNVNKQEVTLDADIIENMSANDVSYNDSFQYDENTVGNKLSELETKLTKNAEISHIRVSDRVIKNDGTNISGGGYWSSISFDISSLKGKIQISSDWNPKEITSVGYSDVLLWSIFSGSAITSELIAQGTTASDGLTSAEIDLDTITGYKTLLEHAH